MESPGIKRPIYIFLHNLPYNAIDYVSDHLNNIFTIIENSLSKQTQSILTKHNFDKRLNLIHRHITLQRKMQRMDKMLAL